MSLSSLGKMTTSGSEQSMPDMSMDRSTDSNRATYFFQHLSDDQQVEDDQYDQCFHHRNTTSKKETSVLRRKDVDFSSSPCFDGNEFGEFNDEAIDEYHEDVLVTIRKHSLTYSKEDIDQMLTKAEQMVCSHSKTSSEKINEDAWEASGESDDEVTKRLTLPPFQPIVSKRKSQISAKRVSLKEVSTLDSNVNKSWGATQTKQSRTWEVESLREDDISAGEISSGDLSSHDSEDRRSRLSNVISDLWDEENYLSEHNYDEPLDDDKARRLLSFGDDYRNFMSSMSGSQTSLNDTLTKNSKRCRKRSKKKQSQVVSELSNDSQSDNELEEVCNVIADSHKKLKNVEKLATEFFVDGFIKKENLKEYHGLVQTCTEYLKHLIHLLQSVELDDSFVSKKKSREIRILVSCWENLLRKIKENIELTSVYEKLGNDISSFRHDLVSVMQQRNTSSMSNKSEDLAEKLKQHKDTMEQLSNFKTRLFGLNLGVHNFLATLSCSQMVDENQVNLAIRLKEEVVEMYGLWDKAHHQNTQDINNAEEAMRKYNHFQEELQQLKRMLDQDVNLIKKNCGRKPRRKSGKHSSSADSGISDSSGGFSDADIPQREQHLIQLRILAKELEQEFSPGSPALEVISETLETTSSQLEDLQNTYQKYKKAQRMKKRQDQLKKEKRHEQLETEKKQKQLDETIDNEEVKEEFEKEYWSFSRKFKVGKVAAMMSCGFVCLVFMSWMSQPDCCEAINNLSFTTQFRYVNGPPPI